MSTARRVSPTGKAGDRRMPRPANLSGPTTEGEFGRRARPDRPRLRARPRGAPDGDDEHVADGPQRRSPTATSGPTPTSRRRCSPRSATTSLDALIDAAVPARDPRARAARRSPTALSRDRGARARCARSRRPQRGVHLAHRARLLRHDHAAGDPAQRAREPGLVHRVHAVPARDLAGPARGARSTSRRWSATSPAWRSRTRRCSTRRPPRPRRWRCCTA